MPVGVRIEVEGAEEVVRAFKALGGRASDLSGAWTRIGALVRTDAVTLAPVLTSSLVNTIRAGKAKTRATVSAGGYGVLHAGVINWGWPEHGIEPTYFLNEAAERNEEPAARELVTEMDRLIALCGLA